MLSPHEIAALLLLGDAQDIDDLEPEQLDGLLVHKLVTMEHGHGSGNAHPRLTSQGASMFEALRRIPLTRRVRQAVRSSFLAP